MNINLTTKYTTKNGQEVRIFELDGYGEYKILGAIRASPESKWMGFVWRPDGTAGQATEGGECFSLVASPAWRAWNVGEAPSFIIASPFGGTEKVVLRPDQMTQAGLTIMFCNYRRYDEKGIESMCGVFG